MVVHLAFSEHAVTVESCHLHRRRVVRALGDDVVIDPTRVLDGSDDEESTTEAARCSTEAARSGLRVSPRIAASVTPHVEPAAHMAGGEVPAHGLCNVVPKDWAAQPDRSY